MVVMSIYLIKLNWPHSHQLSHALVASHYEGFKDLIRKRQFILSLDRGVIYRGELMKNLREYATIHQRRKNDGFFLENEASWKHSLRWLCKIIKWYWMDSVNQRIVFIHVLISFSRELPGGVKHGFDHAFFPRRSFTLDRFRSIFIHNMIIFTKQTVSNACIRSVCSQRHRCSIKQIISSDHIQTDHGSTNLRMTKQY